MRVRPRRADSRAVLRPGVRVLDAGCGTGALARKMIEIEPRVSHGLVSEVALRTCCPIGLSVLPGAVQTRDAGPRTRLHDTP